MLTWPKMRYQQTYSDYSREWFDNNARPAYERRADVLEGLGMSARDSIVVVGCGLGFLQLVLSERGFTATGIDASAYVVAEAHVQVPEVTVHRVDVRDDHTGRGPFDWVVSEFAAECCCGNVTDAPGPTEDEEIAAFLDGCDRLARGGLGNVVHFVTMFNRPKIGFVSKTLEQWAAIEPLHHWREG